MTSRDPAVEKVSQDDTELSDVAMEGEGSNNMSSCGPADVEYSPEPRLASCGSLAALDSSMKGSPSCGERNGLL